MTQHKEGSASTERRGALDTAASQHLHELRTSIIKARQAMLGHQGERPETSTFPCHGACYGVAF